MALFANKQTQNVATIHEGALILSLMDAQAPCVWRMDLAQARLSALELRDENGATILQIRTPKGDQHVIATYHKRERALEILNQVAATLSGTSAPLPSAPSKITLGNWVWFGVALIAVFILLSFVGGAGQKPLLKNATGSSPAATGEPINADAFLEK